ncbi:MAG: NAD(P)-dependent oxidoreductase [Roseburia sp.]|nr:NAD(P)-dependent oxidoreductase [Roseburia sp.]
MKIVVTGATGFVGKWLVAELLRQGDEVTVVVRDKRRIPDEWKNLVYVVEAELQTLSRLDKKNFPWDYADMFFHLAWSGTAGMERADTILQLQNVQAACDAVRLAKRLECGRFVNAGSIMEYEAMQYISSDGSMPGMGNIYSTAKVTADFMAKTVATKEGIGYINVIISNIYGAGEKSARFLNTTLRKMLYSEAIELTHGCQLYDFIYVTDAVRQIVLAGKRGEVNSVYYIGNAIQRPLKEFVVEMKQVLHSDSELMFGKIPFSGAMLTYKEFDTSKLEKLGFVSEVSFAEGVKLTRDWMLEEEHEH